jgi:hypothetical protein
LGLPEIFAGRPPWPPALQPGPGGPGFFLGAGGLKAFNDYNLFQNLVFYKMVILSVAKNLVFLNT